MIGSNDPTGSTPTIRLPSPTDRTSFSFRTRLSSLPLVALVAALLSVGALVVVSPVASAQTGTGSIPVSTNATGVQAPGPTNVTSQIVDTNQVASVIGATIAVPPTNSPGVVVTPATPTETVAETLPPTTKARRKKRVTPPTTTVPVAKTKTADTAPPTATSVAAPAVVAAGNGAIPESAWAALRKCESGGNYRTNTGNGYYGAYQFALATWRRLGYTGYPHEASPAIQDEAARKLQAKAGWGQWPACTRKLGLR